MAYANDELISGLDAAGALDPDDLAVLQQDGQTIASKVTLAILAYFIYQQISDNDPALTADSDDLLPSKSAVKGYVDRHFAPVVTESGTSHNITNAEAGSYIRFTNGSPKTVTFRDDATEPLDADVEYHLRVEGADLTIVAGSTDVVFNEPFDGTLVLSEGMTVTVKRISADVFDVFGHTVAA